LASSPFHYELSFNCERRFARLADASNSNSSPFFIFLTHLDDDAKLPGIEAVSNCFFPRSSEATH
jgi:hypothetical protein